MSSLAISTALTLLAERAMSWAHEARGAFDVRHELDTSPPAIPQRGTCSGLATLDIMTTSGFAAMPPADLRGRGLERVDAHAATAPAPRHRPERAFGERARLGAQLRGVKSSSSRIRTSALDRAAARARPRRAGTNSHERRGLFVHSKIERVGEEGAPGFTAYCANR